MNSERYPGHMGWAVAAWALIGCVPMVPAQDWTLAASFDVATVPVGSHVAMELDGDLLFVAICGAQDGTVRVHQRHQGGFNQWGVLGSVHRDDPWFGRSIALNDGLLAVGSPATEQAGPFTGEVRLYQLDLEPGADALQPVDVIGLGDQTANDRFGYTVHWLGDTLAVSAVGRPVSRSFGVVYLFSADQNGAQPIGPLPFSSQQVQVPFIRWFGATISHYGERLVVAAPFTGFEPARPRQNVGSVHLYRRDGSEPSGWALDTAWSDTRTATDATCAFQRMELGRWGLAFAGEDLVMDHAGYYDGVPGNAFEPWLFPATGQGCDACGLRIVQHAGDAWDLSGSSAPTQANPQDEREAEGWTVQNDALFVERFDAQDTTWATAVHRRDQGGPGNWGIEATVPATGPCDRLEGPLAVSGTRLARVVAREGPACDVPDGSVLYRVEILGQ